MAGPGCRSGRFAQLVSEGPRRLFLRVRAGLASRSAAFVRLLAVASSSLGGRSSRAQTLHYLRTAGRTPTRHFEQESFRCRSRTDTESVQEEE